jgi:hypothetical protein
VDNQSACDSILSAFAGIEAVTIVIVIPLTRVGMLSGYAS